PGRGRGQGRRPGVLGPIPRAVRPSLCQAVAARSVVRCAHPARVPHPDPVEPAVRGGARFTGQRRRGVGWRDQSRGGRRRDPIPARAITDRARLGLTALLAVYGGFLILHPSHYGWLDSLDLAIHEFGHPVFGIFGEFIGLLGGTLMQLLMPPFFVAYFLRRGDPHAAMLSLWWVPQHLAHVSFVLGAFWYPPVLFARQGIQAQGYSPEKVQELKKKKGMTRAYAVSVLCYVVTAYVVALLAGYTNSTTLAQGLWLGFLFWLGFAATIGLAAHMFSEKPIAAWVIDAGYQLAYLVI